MSEPQRPQMPEPWGPVWDHAEDVWSLALMLGPPHDAAVAATAHVRSSLCPLSSAVLCAAELRRQSHHDAVGALSSTRTSAALRTMPSGGAVVPPSVVTYITFPTSPGSRPQ
jgi:hypothetical protein